MVLIIGFEEWLLIPNTFSLRVPSIALYNIPWINLLRSLVLTALEADERAIHISVWWKLMEDNVTENTTSHGSWHEQRKNSFSKIEAISYCFPKRFRVIRIVDAFAEIWRSANAIRGGRRNVRAQSVKLRKVLKLHLRW